jgi:predicted aspartyl protease
MGVFKVNAWVWNPSTPEKKVLLELLVDTGATYTVLPESLLKSLGVKPYRVARLRLADNRILEKSLGEIGIEVEGYRASATPVVFGEEEEVYLLGSVTMEQLGLAPDPIAKMLKPVEALLMQIRNS